MIDLAGCMKVPESSIKEARFNFSDIYEEGGELEIVSSVFVCKFVDAGRMLDGCYLDWDNYI